MGAAFYASIAQMYILRTCMGFPCPHMPPEAGGHGQRGKPLGTSGAWVGSRCHYPGAGRPPPKWRLPGPGGAGQGLLRRHLKEGSRGENQPGNESARAIIAFPDGKGRLPAPHRGKPPEGPAPTARRSPGPWRWIRTRCTRRIKCITCTRPALEPGRDPAAFLHAPPSGENPHRDVRHREVCPSWTRCADERPGPAHRGADAADRAQTARGKLPASGVSWSPTGAAEGL